VLVEECTSWKSASERESQSADYVIAQFEDNASVNSPSRRIFG
jgi:hypothetical protein